MAPTAASSEPTTEGKAPALLAIGQAAARCDVSERALRYYEEIGLLTPCSRTPGGLRRYSAEDLDRVARIRELQTLLGLNLDEVGAVLANEDRLAGLRHEYHAEATDAARRRELIEQGLRLRMELRGAVEGKRDAPAAVPRRARRRGGAHGGPAPRRDDSES